MKNNLSRILKYSVLILFCLFLSSCTLSQTSKTTEQELESIRQELQKTIDELNVMREEIELHKEILDELQEENTTVGKHLLQEEAVAVKKTAYTEPILLYKEGRSSLLKEEYDIAIKIFTEFLEKYPHNDLADNALYWIGECHYAVTDFKKAIITFKNVVEKYPRGMKVPDALLKTAYSYFSLKDTNRAHHYLKLVVEKYPFSEASEKAQIKLKTFQ
ncbi:MAG: tol-pal system protein YbgF [Desulfobacteraceae bacterium]|nr:tol-pal system protein YbgF [Desulfobacteraceae bacterium]